MNDIRELKELEMNNIFSWPNHFVSMMYYVSTLVLK